MLFAARWGGSASRASRAFPAAHGVPVFLRENGQPSRPASPRNSTASYRAFTQREVHNVARNGEKGQNEKKSF